MIRRTSAVIAVVALVLTTTSCSESPGDFYGDQTDVARAQAVWRDPWVAPSSSTVAEAGWGTDGQVGRTVARRVTAYLGADPLGAVRQEVDLARSGEWQLVGVTCAPELTTAVLTRGDDDLDQAAVAEVTATAVDPRDTDVAVEVQVPHHLDEDWPDLGPAVTLDDTCLADVDGPPAPDLPGGEPRGEADDGIEAPEWSEVDPGEDDLARASALAADPWFDSVGRGLDVADAGRESGRTTRHAPQATGTLDTRARTPVAALAETVAAMDGWLVTYVACARRTGAVATLRLDTGSGPVVVRLEASPRAPGSVGWTATLPVVRGPDQSWIDQVPALGSSACLAGRAAPAEPTLEGTPVSLPASLQPLQE